MAIAMTYGRGDYTYWHSALRGEKPAMHDGEMHAGFYRMTRKGRSDDAVSYFWHGSDLVCLINGKPQPNGGADVWTFCGHNAVSHEDYLHRIKEGRWPNDAEMVAKSNQPPDDNSIEAVVARLEELEREAKQLIEDGPAKDQNRADIASDVANSIGEIEKKVIELHKVEKQPHLNAGRAVDAKWFSVRDRAITGKANLKHKVVAPFLVQLRRAAEAELKRAKEMGVEEFLEQPKIGAGSIKRTTALRPKVTAKIMDIDALLMSLKDNPEVRELVQRLADAAARGGNPLPGSVRVETETAV